MICTNLSEHLEQARGGEGGLCCVCERIDFVSSTEEACGSKGIDCFLLGPLRHIANKDFCPGCRMILSATQFINVARGLPLDAFHDCGIELNLDSPFALMLDPDTRSLRTATAGDEVTIRPPYTDRSISVTIWHNNPRNRGGQKLKAGRIIRAHDQNSTRSITSATVLPSGEEFHYRGRRLPLHVNFDLIRRWMQICKSQHAKCHVPLHLTANAERIRLIDVQDYKIVPAYSGGSILPYVALSYVWGKGAIGLLRKDNLQLCISSNGLRILEFPPTISNAIEVLKSIGGRYLWVDTLCIVQDDDADKLEQLPIMDQIYGCAELVIAAAAGDNIWAGLPGVGKTQRTISQQSETINGTQFVTCHPFVHKLLYRSVWDTRGWTFQETALCKRLLIFTEGQIYWLCRTATWHEDTSGEAINYMHLSTVANSLSGHLFQEGICRMKLYCELVQVFSRRRFTDERDALWAFAGILKLMTPHFPKGFIWGLPCEALDAALLWKQCCSKRCTTFHLRSAKHRMNRNVSDRDLPFPSWSWLSCNVLVGFLSPCRSPVISEVTWLEPIALDHATAGKYFDSILTTRREDGLGKDQDHNLFSASSLEIDTMQYGLLQFTAQSSTLTLKRMEGKDRVTKEDRELRGGEDTASTEAVPENIVSSEVEKTTWVVATVHAPDEEEIGLIETLSDLFGNNSECSAEVILLSSNADCVFDESCKRQTEADIGCVQHVYGCDHVRSRNISVVPET